MTTAVCVVQFHEIVTNSPLTIGVNNSGGLSTDAFPGDNALASWVIPITAIQINKQRLGVNFLKRPDDFISINEGEGQSLTIIQSK